jgi:hypothetical protein
MKRHRLDLETIAEYHTLAEAAYRVVWGQTLNVVWGQTLKMTR